MKNPPYFDLASDETQNIWLLRFIAYNATILSIPPQHWSSDAVTGLKTNSPLVPMGITAFDPRVNGLLQVYTLAVGPMGLGTDGLFYVGPTSYCI